MPSTMNPAYLSPLLGVPRLIDVLMKSTKVVLIYLPSLSAIETVACVGAIRLASGADSEICLLQSLW